MGKGDGKLREEKCLYYQRYDQRLLVLRIQGADECVRQVETLQVWATEAMGEDLAA